MIQIQSIFDRKRVAFSIEADELKNLFVSDKLIALKDNVLEIGMTKAMLLIHSKDRDFRDGAMIAPKEKDDRRINNIDAYDWEGNHLWNIGDIVGDIKRQFNGFDLTTRELLKGELPKGFADDLDPSLDSHDLLICIADIYMYIIDLQDLKILKKIPGKW